MEPIAFNLLQEPWIRVLKPDCTVEEVSLKDALLRAHDYRDLAGELATQDVAVLRLLLAVVHTVFYRVDAEGKEAPLKDPKEAVARWKTLWEMGKLPEQPISDYLEKWQDRFWLFHPERPFYQVPEAAIGTAYTAAKLNGEISESSNKLRLFSTYAKEEKNAMSYAQAARWLLYVNGFDDTSAKPKGKGLPSPGVGWLGKLGLLVAQGNTLAETLLLNLVLVRDDNSLWNAPQPCWELDEPRRGERTEIPQPDDAAALLTLQSRRLLLQRDEDLVKGCTVLGGDFFEKKNAFCEPMTLWRKGQENKNAPVFYQPRLYDPTKQFWREFPAAFPQGDDGYTPGIVQWLTKLQRARCLERQRVIHFKCVGVVYGDQNSAAIDAFSDTLAFHSSLLDEMGVSCRARVISEIQNCEKMAEKVGSLARDLAKAAGASGDSEVRAAKEQFYFELDQPFRQWLYQLDPEDNDIDAAVKAWREQVKTIAYRLGRTMVEAAGSAALVGRKVKNKDGTEGRYYSAPKAYHWFMYGVNQVYQKEGDQL